MRLMPRAKYVSKSFTEIDRSCETNTFFVYDVNDFSGYNINPLKCQTGSALDASLSYECSVCTAEVLFHFFNHRLLRVSENP